MITKPFEQISATDIADLCAHDGTYESLTLEFKQELPNRDGQPDPWLAGRSFTNYARDHLFREIVALANASGGTLVLGIAETEDLPPRAATVMPLPRIHELATRLEEAARACIEPPLPSLLVRGIATVDEETGVVIFRTVASPFGPHRVAGDGHTYIRRGASSVKMTMREIQDLTLDLARGADRLDSTFNERASAFSRWFRYSSLADKGGLRITAVPVSRLPRDVRILEQADRMPRGTRHAVRIGDVEHDLVLPDHGFTTRPTLRGVRLYYDREDYALRLDILNSGVVDLWIWKRYEQNLHFYIGWILGAILTILRLTDWIRGLAAAPEWEFALEIALDGITAAPAPPDARVTLSALALCDLNLGHFREMRSLSGLPIRFPRLAVRSRADEEDVINTVWGDLNNASGVQVAWPRITIRQD
jgi:hypothetical protein